MQTPYALSPELFARIRGIQLRAQRLVTAMLAGEYASAFKGRGMEFEKVREYQPGDDVRHIDWNVTARMRAPYVKEFREERELTVVLLVDVSASGAFGSGTRLKQDVAAEVAAILAYTAIRNNDRVGVLLFSDHVEHYVPAKKGRGHVWQVIRAILTHRSQMGGTDLTAALAALGRVARRRAVVFLISDFLDAGFADALALASRRHELCAVHIVDPRETELPPVGLVQLEDAETGALCLVDTQIAGGQLLAPSYNGRSLTTVLRQAGVGSIRIDTQGSSINPILRYLRRREGGGRGPSRGR